MPKKISPFKRCWTHYVFNKIFKNKPPVTFSKSVEIIETMHETMIEHLMEHRRPIQIKKSIGYLDLVKIKPKPGTYAIDWKKTRQMGKVVKQLNHHTSGYIFKIQLRQSGHSDWRLYKFNILRRHNRELAKRIINKDVQ